MNAELVSQLKSLEEAVEAAATDREQANALNSLAREIRDDDPGRARTLAEQAQRLASALADESALARSLHLQGHADYRLGSPEQARELYSQALDICRRSGDRAVEADCLHDLGILATIRAGYVEALTYHCEALRLYEALRDAAGQAQTLNDLGNAHMGQGDLGQALSYYLRSLKQREELGNVVGVGCSLNNIGNVYTALEDHAQALDYYTRCLEISRQTGATRLEARCQGNLTDTHIALGHPEKAAESSLAALTLARRCGYRSDECYALMGQGSAHQAVGESALAASLFQEALPIALALSDRTSVCQIYLLLGEASLEANALADARAFLCCAAEMAEGLALRQYLFPAFRGLAHICKAEGDFAQALAYHEMFHTLEKEVLSGNADKRLQALMIQMDLEKAQKEAEFSRQEADLHRLKTVELARTNQALLQANEDNEHLLEELRAQADNLERQATQDGLTGLYNRRYLADWLSNAFLQAKLSGDRLTVALVDVDYFKQINDQFGHQVGDEVLMTLAQLMRKVCRATDLVARYGGEEFLLSLTMTAAGGEICERLRHEVASYPWQAIHLELAVTVSIGYSGDLSVADHERLLALADAQLYEAKRLGRNRVCGQERNLASVPVPHECLPHPVPSPRS